MDNATRFMQDGGTIKIIPAQPDRKYTPQEKKYLRKHKKKELPIAPKEGYSPEICVMCENVGLCLYRCYPLSWIDGYAETKEKLLSNPEDLDKYDRPDYNVTIHKLMREKEKISDADVIRLIPNPRIKAIAAMLNADLTISQIAPIIKLSRQQIYALIRLYTETAR